jgi:hypothetical protein
MNRTPVIPWEAGAQVTAEWALPVQTVLRLQALPGAMSCAQALEALTRQCGHSVVTTCLLEDLEPWDRWAWPRAWPNQDY